jgi:uncharacterized protein (DUF39 family)
MQPEWLRGVSMPGYGASLAVGIGVPIPILNEEVFRSAAVSDAEIFAPLVDYSEMYPQRKPGNLGLVSYAQLKSGTIVVQGKEVRTNPLSSYPRARRIAGMLKEWIQCGQFFLAEPVQLLPALESGITVKTLEVSESRG